MERFPTHAQAAAVVAFGEKYQDHCRGQQALYPDLYWHWQDAINFSNAKMAAWYALRQATDPDLTPAYCQRGLEDLRELLSPSEWAWGRLPFPAPIHRFVEIP